MKIWIVDAFASKPYTGNPAAIMIVDEFPINIHQIAAEMNLSETVFVKKIEGQNNLWHIRWHTPTVEVKLCGHGTLAAAHILFEQNLIPGDEIQFASLSGTLTVKREGTSYILDFPLQHTGEMLDVHELQKVFPNHKIISAVKAYDDVIVEFEDETELTTMIPQMDLIQTVDALSVIVTARGQKYDFISRVFAPRDGIDEDPVTGSAHCKLAHYWHQKLGVQHFKAYQASARGGFIELEIQDERVLLKGQAVTVLEGLFYGHLT